MFDLIAEFIRWGFASYPEATFAALVAMLAAVSAVAAKLI